jgi:VWFA-related protein
MKTKVSLVLLTFLATVIMAPLAEQSARAQAPAGQQGGAPPPKDTKPQTPATQQPQAPQAGVSITVEVPVVTLDVIAATQHGDLLTGLKKENFRVIDDGVAKTITNFGPTEAPITIVMLMEYSSRGYELFASIARYWGDAFLPNLQQKDWIALRTFDMNVRDEVDFTQNKDEVRAALYHLGFPGFRESNVFDAVLKTVDDLKDVKGKKSILLLASGVDTFSKHTLDQTMKALRQSDVTVFCVGLDKPFTNWLESHGALGSNLNYLQAENQMKTMANLTGGYAWFPQFDGELPGIFHDVAAFLRHQYSISYTPSSGAKDTKFHKVKIELVKPDGSPLEVLDQKGKKQKWVVYAREGYEPQKPVGAN